VRLAKHGNRSFTSRSGSADVLEAMGVVIELAPEAMAEILEEVSTAWVEVPPGPADGKTLVDLQVRAKTGASVLAVRRGDRTTPNPPPHFGISAGDALLVLTPPDGLRKLRALLAGEGPPRPAAE